MYIDKDKVPEIFKNKKFPLSKEDRKKLNLKYKFEYLRVTKERKSRLSQFYRHEDTTPFRDLIKHMPGEWSNI